MIIGLTGVFGAGKDAAATYLQTLGFVHHSLSDVIREVIRERDGDLSLANLIRVGNELRETGGSGYLAQVVLSRIQRLGVVSSIRHPAELEVFYQSGRFFLCNLDAPMTLRFERIQGRERAGEQISFEEFAAIEYRQLTGAGNSQRLQDIIRAADYTLVNDQDFGYLHKQIDVLLDDIRRRLRRGHKTSQDQLRLL